MTYALVRARYADDTARTVSPGRLLTMLYDRLVSDLSAAEDAMRRQDIADTGHRLGRAQEILLELRSSLDTTAWPEGEALGQLYLWMVSELMTARVRNEPKRVADCRALVEPLREAWRAAALQTGAVSTEGPGLLGGAA